jgi:uncharacterized protein (UPF0147 family)
MSKLESPIRKSLEDKIAEFNTLEYSLNPNFKRIMDIFDSILNDRTVPKNIRSVVENSKNILISKEDNLEVKISSVINNLDSIMSDANMPLYTRTQIWNLVSLLEEERNKFLKNK